MHVPRRLPILLASGALALTGAAPTFAQSAGDEQYSDPLGQTDTGTSSAPSLTEEPRGDGGGSGSGSGSGSSGSGSGSGSGSSGAGSNTGSSGSGSGSAGSGAGSGVAGTSTGSAPSSSAPTGSSGGTAAATRLPNTGAEPGVIGVLGLALLLVGIGLRLRTADARL